MIEESEILDILESINSGAPIPEGVSVIEIDRAGKPFFSQVYFRGLGLYRCTPNSFVLLESDEYLRENFGING